LQDRTDNPLRSSKRLTSASHDPWKDHARHRERVPAMILRPRSILGTIFSSRCQISRVHRPHEIRAHATRSCLFDTMTVTNFVLYGRASSPDWWSQTGSNRRPPACKAGALPAELWPLIVGVRLRLMHHSAATFILSWLATIKLRSSEGWWAWEDLNFRPHAYQARALTN
jgi:hypothetical protein